MQLQKIIVILGPPGSGKGTQSKLLVEEFGFGFFSMGEALRSFATNDDETGRKIKALIDQGLIVTDDLAQIVVTQTWTGMLNKPVMISEGYPRTMGQVDLLDRFMHENNIVSLQVLSIQADKQKLIDRILLRSKKEGRADDADIAAIEKRFAEYEDKTAKIIEYYRQKNLVIEIDGDQAEDMQESIQKIHQEILNKLGLK